MRMGVLWTFQLPPSDRELCDAFKSVRPDRGMEAGRRQRGKSYPLICFLIPYPADSCLPSALLLLILQYMYVRVYNSPISKSKTLILFSGSKLS